jgi:hypothetical protein
MHIRHSRLSRKPGTSHNLPRRFRPADAPPAAVNRSLRREWAAVANAALNRTGDPDAAQRAGAEMLAAALDMDSRVAAIARRARKGRPPLDRVSHLPTGAIRRRARGDDDSAIEAILAGATP